MANKNKKEQEKQVQQNGFKFHECISKFEVKKVTPSNRKTIMRINDFINGVVK